MSFHVDVIICALDVASFASNFESDRPTPFVASEKSSLSLNFSAVNPDGHVCPVTSNGAEVTHLHRKLMQQTFSPGTFPIPEEGTHSLSVPRGSQLGLADMVGHIRSTDSK
jgi:hypothetical protein